MTRRDLDPQDLGRGAFYRLLTTVVVPRPIAWVSTTSAEGVDNLAPHSFFTVAGTDPPVVQFTSTSHKDSLRNVEATGEMVVHLCPETLFEQVNATGTDFPPEVSEFDAVGLTREPSLRVRPPRVAESPVALECVLHATVPVGRSTLVLGRVVHAAIDEAVLADDGLPDVELLRPLSRLGRDQWGGWKPVRAVSRIPFAQWPGDYRPPS